MYGGVLEQPVLVSSRSWEINRIDQLSRVRQTGKRVRYVIDRMTMPDVPRVVEIERLAYPSTWPPSAYRKELQENPWAHYIVLRPAIFQPPNLASIIGFAGLWLMDEAH